MTSPAHTDKRDTLGAYALMAAVVLALCIANSPLADWYQQFLLRPLTIGIRRWHSPRTCCTGSTTGSWPCSSC